MQSVVPGGFCIVFVFGAQDVCNLDDFVKCFFGCNLFLFKNIVDIFLTMRYNA